MKEQLLNLTWNQNTIPKPNKEFTRKTQTDSPHNHTSKTAQQKKLAMYIKLLIYQNPVHSFPGYKFRITFETD